LGGSSTVQFSGSIFASLFRSKAAIPPAPWKSEDLDPASIEAIIRGMRMDLALGLAHGFYAGPLLLLALRVTSTDSAELYGVDGSGEYRPRGSGAVAG
jgi:hypothetical protein